MLMKKQNMEGLNFMDIIWGKYFLNHMYVCKNKVNMYMHSGVCNAISSTNDWNTVV